MSNIKEIVVSARFDPIRFSSGHAPFAVFVATKVVRFGRTRATNRGDDISDEQFHVKTRSSPHGHINGSATNQQQPQLHTTTTRAWTNLRMDKISLTAFSTRGSDGDSTVNLDDSPEGCGF